MEDSWGLRVDRKKFFVCDGKYGLKVFDASEPEQIQHVETIDYINGYDIIPHEHLLIVSARDGIYQFDYKTQ